MSDGHHHHHHLPVREHLRLAKGQIKSEAFDEAYRELSVAIHLIEDHDASSELEDDELAELYLMRASALMAAQKARVFRDTDTFHQVLEDLEQAVTAQPMDMKYRLFRAQFYKRSEFADYLKEAREDLDIMVKQDENDVEALREMGEVMVLQKEFKNAIPLLSKAITLEESPEAYSSRGLAYFKKTPPDYQAAAKDFYQAQLANPHDENLYLWRAQCFQELQLWSDALREYELLISFSSDKPGYYVDRGFIKDMMGDENGAFEDYSLALNLAPHAMAYNNRSMHYLRLGQHEEAIEDARAALEADPELHIAHASLAEIFATTGDREEMLHSLKHAMGSYYEDAVAVMLEPAFEAYLEDPDFLEVIGK